MTRPKDIFRLEGRRITVGTEVTLPPAEMVALTALAEAIGWSVKQLVEDSIYNAFDSTIPWHDILFRCRANRYDLAADLIGSADTWGGKIRNDWADVPKWTEARLRARWPLAREKEARDERSWQRCVDAALEPDGRRVRRLMTDLICKRATL